VTVFEHPGNAPAGSYREYLEDASRRGDPPTDSFSGAAGGSACGDLVRVSLLPGADLRVVRVTWEAEGCSAMVASAAALAELVEGGSLLDAARTSPDRIEERLGHPGRGVRHATVLVADALHRALSALASSGHGIAEDDPNRIGVALSGGVDSAVAALALRDGGREPVAITVKLWADPATDGTKACCSPEAVLSARNLAHSLGLAHFTLDLEESFRSRVVERFLDGYRNGTTPNPCIACNGSVRIDAMVELVGRIGAGRLATGHYATVTRDGEGVLLAEASDPEKDQSYMLAGIPPDTVTRLEFPLSGMTKPEVREVAARHGLAVARKPESQDLCFLAGTGKNAFLERHAGLADRPGPVIDRDGTRMGTHRGHHRFTVGQRRGLGVAVGEPRYVTSVDAGSNTVTIGAHDDLLVDEVTLSDATLLRDGEAVDRVRLRYRSEPVGASVGSGAGSHDRLVVRLDRPFPGPAPGQTAVLMRGSAIVGHGTIE
jgi:tRNA-specific 2-thiouridylase